MSRFLQRLVQRAHGTGESLQPRPRSLFEPAAAPGTPAPAGAGEESTRPAVTAAPEPPRPAEPRDSAPEARAAGPDGARAAREASAPARQPDGDTRPAPAVTPSAASALAPAPGPAAGRPAVPPPARHAPTPSGSDREPPPAVDPLSARPAWPAHAHPAVGEGPARSTAARPAVTGPPAGLRHASLARQAVSQGAPAPRAPQAAPEHIVHVTVEHFEVSALTAPPSRANAPRAPREDTLADYARRRQERRR